MPPEWILSLASPDAEEGINNGNIVMFKENLYGSLVREVLQNSLDERFQKDKPVRVTIADYALPVNHFPDRNVFLGHIRNCRLHWSGSAQDNETLFFRAVENVLSQDTIHVLRISDFNTNGITGSDYQLNQNARMNTPWKVLVKQESSSSKGTTQSGSYGIGKYAAFAASTIRTVFYSTYDKNRLQAFEGVAKLATHTAGGQAYGSRWYYGQKDRQYPALSRAVPRILSLDPDFSRTEQGSDIFIMGFDSDDSLWREKMQLTVLSDFFIPIVEGALEVQIGDSSINSYTISSAFSRLEGVFNARGASRYREAVNEASQYYQVFSDTESQVFSKEFPDYGKAELKVVYRPDYNRKVIRTREAGMTLFKRGNISSNFGFAGIVRLYGEKLSKLFRDMENPAHDKWDPGFTKPENKRISAKFLGDLDRWIRETIREHAINHESDEMDVSGLGHYLPFDMSDEQQPETQASSAGNVQIRIAPRKSEDTQKTIESESEAEGNPEDMGADAGEHRPPQGAAQGASGNPGNGHSNLFGDGDKTYKRLTFGKEYKIRYLRAGASGNLLLVQTARDIQNAMLRVSVASESNAGQEIVVKSAVSGRNKLAYPVRANRVMIGDLKENTILDLWIELKDAMNYALEVMMYENQ